MYHDAPVEAAVTTHRHRNRATTALTATSQDASQRIIHEYQLYRVANFLLTGTDGKETQPLNTESSKQQDSAEVTNRDKSSCCNCRWPRAARAGAAPLMFAALQFPDELLSDSVAVVRALQQVLTSDPRYHEAMKAKLETCGGNNTTNNSSTSGDAAAMTSSKLSVAGSAISARPPAMDNPHRPVAEVRLFVLADNTFGSCCPDEITAQHYMADCIVHFGDACMSRSTRLPVLYIQPQFHFDAIMSDRLRSADPRPSPEQRAAIAEAEMCVVLGLVERVAAALRRRAIAWWAEQRSTPAERCSVVPRLTVVGTYATKQIMQVAEQRWNDKRKVELGDAAVNVDWPRFEERNGIVPTTPVKNSSGNNASEIVPGASKAALANVEAPDFQPPVVDEDWLVNGVRFYRLRCNDDTARQTVQYLLFIGAAGSSALVHVLTAEQYNEFHYSDACRMFLEWDSRNEETSVPVVMVVNNTLGVDVQSGDAQKKSMQALFQSPTRDTNFNSVLKDSVAAWLAVTLTDGVSALLTGDYVVAQQVLQRRVRQRTFNIESVRGSTAIGVLVASLAIEGYYELTQKLHQLIRAYGKRSYIIYVGHLNEFKLANFVDTVDCFVVVACPYSRQSHFPEKRDNFMKPIVSPAELLVALTTSDDDTEADKQYGMAAVYTTSFEAILHVLKDAVEARKKEIARRAEGDEEGRQRQKAEEERWTSSGALVRACGAGNGVLTVQDSSQGALARLYEREYVGLDPRIGETPVQTELIEGKHGIARGYTKEREEQHTGPPVPQYE